MDPRNPPQVLVHFYRAAVMHADVWRQRLDATTNWAVVTTAAVLTFSFASRNTEHFVVLVALAFDFFFLFMESRRYQMYNLWQRRIRVLHRYLVTPALAEPESDEAREARSAKLVELAGDLGRTVPAIRLAGALGYRIRRNYGPLVTLVILTWLLKLYVHPFTAEGLAAYVERARVGFVPGSWMLLGVAAFFATFVYLAIRAPSEQMAGWQELPPPIDRIMPPGFKLPGAERRAGRAAGLRPRGPGEDGEEARSKGAEGAGGRERGG